MPPSPRPASSETAPFAPAGVLCGRSPKPRRARSAPPGLPSPSSFPSSGALRNGRRASCRHRRRRGPGWDRRDRPRWRNTRRGPAACGYGCVSSTTLPSARGTRAGEVGAPSIGSRATGAPGGLDRVRLGPPPRSVRSAPGALRCPEPGRPRARERKHHGMPVLP